MAQSPCFLSPLANSLLLSFLTPLYLLGNPPSCDRISPPWSQVACKLTSPSQPFPQSLPPPIPRTQVIKRLTMATSRIRRLLSGTDIFTNKQCIFAYLLNIFTALKFWHSFKSMFLEKVCARSNGVIFTRGVATGICATSSKWKVPFSLQWVIFEL